VHDSVVVNQYSFVVGHHHHHYHHHHHHHHHNQHQVGKHHAACIAVSPDGTQLVAAGETLNLLSMRLLVISIAM
jgi:hypothetical protein